MLTTCLKCGTRYAPDLPVCPHCGTPAGSGEDESGEDGEEDGVPKISRSGGVSFPPDHDLHGVPAPPDAAPEDGGAEPEVTPDAPSPDPPAAPPRRTPPPRPPAPEGDSGA